MFIFYGLPHNRLPWPVTDANLAKCLHLVHLEGGIARELQGCACMLNRFLQNERGCRLALVPLFPPKYRRAAQFPGKPFRFSFRSAKLQSLATFVFPISIRP